MIGVSTFSIKVWEAGKLTGAGQIPSIIEFIRYNLFDDTSTMSNEKKIVTCRRK